MDSCGSSSNTTGLQRVAIKDLMPDMDNILVVALMIGKQRPRKFADKNKESSQFRAVWNFTLRDSPRDYINVTYWGGSDEVCAASDKFYTGDVVEIRNPRINIRKFNDAGEQYRPVVTSPYSLTLNEYSEIVPHSGDTFSLMKLLSIPTKPLAGFVPIRDIHNEGANMKERFIDILGAVRSIGTIRNVNTRTGQDAQVREVLLFDHTSPGLKLTIWDTDVITRAGNWKPRTTILFITEARVEWSNFLKAYSASLTNRSIITENPIGQEALALANYAKTAPIETTDILNQFITTLPDPESIQNVMCVQQVYSKIKSFMEENTADRQLTALMFVFISQLDLDGLLPTTSVKCSNCKTWVKNSSSTCQNSDCPASFGIGSPDLDISFDIRVNLSDHTGTLVNCRLSGASAEQVLNCTVQQFMRMSDEEKCALKWKFLMERCAVRIMVSVLNTRRPVVSIISCSKADPIEMAQRIPIC
ncbi:unnamed protein product [Tenebrio molitor]|nr:unnamed protein product [Tenebrio molitor]